MNKEYKPITNLWKDSEGYRYFGTLKLSSKIKYDGDDFIPLWEWINQLQQENKILKENAENNDKVVDKVNWENMLLKKENKQLKDELKSKPDVQITLQDDKGNKFMVIQTERIDMQVELNKTIEKLFNNWNKLKEYIKETKLKEFEKTYGKRYGKTFTQAEIILCNMILDKMQEIEGDDNNE